MEYKTKKPTSISLIKRDILENETNLLYRKKSKPKLFTFIKSKNYETFHTPTIKRPENIINEELKTISIENIKDHELKFKKMFFNTNYGNKSQTFNNEVKKLQPSRSLVNQILFKKNIFFEKNLQENEELIIIRKFMIDNFVIAKKKVSNPKSSKQIKKNFLEINGNTIYNFSKKIDQAAEMIHFNIKNNIKYLKPIIYHHENQINENFNRLVRKSLINVLAFKENNQLINQNFIRNEILKEIKNEIKTDSNFTENDVEINGLLTLSDKNQSLPNLNTIINPGISHIPIQHEGEFHNILMNQFQKQTKTQNNVENKTRNFQDVTKIYKQSYNEKFIRFNYSTSQQIESVESPQNILTDNQLSLNAFQSSKSENLENYFFSAVESQHEKIESTLTESNSQNNEILKENNHKNYPQKILNKLKKYKFNHQNNEINRIPSKNDFTKTSETTNFRDLNKFERIDSYKNKKNIESYQNESKTEFLTKKKNQLEINVKNPKFKERLKESASQVLNNNKSLSPINIKGELKSDFTIKIKQKTQTTPIPYEIHKINQIKKEKIRIRSNNQENFKKIKGLTKQSLISLPEEDDLKFQDLIENNELPKGISSYIHNDNETNLEKLSLNNDNTEELLENPKENNKQTKILNKLIELKNQQSINENKKLIKKGISTRKDLKSPSKKTKFRLNTPIKEIENENEFNDLGMNNQILNSQIEFLYKSPVSIRSPRTNSRMNNIFATRRAELNSIFIPELFRITPFDHCHTRKRNSFLFVENLFKNQATKDLLRNFTEKIEQETISVNTNKIDNLEDQISMKNLNKLKSYYVLNIDWNKIFGPINAKGNILSDFLEMIKKESTNENNYLEDLEKNSNLKQIEERINKFITITQQNRENKENSKKKIIVKNVKSIRNHNGLTSIMNS